MQNQRKHPHRMLTVREVACSLSLPERTSFVMPVFVARNSSYRQRATKSNWKQSDVHWQTCLPLNCMQSADADDKHQKPSRDDKLAITRRNNHERRRRRQERAGKIASNCFFARWRSHIIWATTLDDEFRSYYLFCQVCEQAEHGVLMWCSDVVSFWPKIRLLLLYAADRSSPVQSLFGRSL